MPCSVPSTSVSSDRQRSPLPARPPAPDLTVDDAIGLYLDSLLARGSRESSAITQSHQLRRFFRPALGEPLCTLTVERIEALTTALAESTHGKTGDRLAATTRYHLTECARRFCQWCTAQGRLAADPMGVRQKTPEQLQFEINKLRRDLGSVRQELAEAREQLAAAQGGR